eukprot:2320807-Prymnesium_polylepis.1
MASTRTLAPASRPLPDIMTVRHKGLHMMCGARTRTQTAPPSSSDERLKEKTESGYEVTVVGAVDERPNRWWAGRGRVPH